MRLNPDQCVLLGDEPRSVPTSIPYQRHSRTSQVAAESIRHKLSDHERDVYNAIVAAGEQAITRKELAATIGWAENQQNRITGRVAKLIERGLVVDLQRSRERSNMLVTSGVAARIGA